jgi:hypothetical protein
VGGEGLPPSPRRRRPGRGRGSGPEEGGSPSPGPWLAGSAVARFPSSAPRPRSSLCPLRGPSVPPAGPSITRCGSRPTRPGPRSRPRSRSGLHPGMCLGRRRRNALVKCSAGQGTKSDGMESWRWASKCLHCPYLRDRSVGPRFVWE